MAKESILQVSSVFLFGRELEDLTIKKPGFPAERVKRGGANRFLQDQLEDEFATLARIYAFSYEAGFYELAQPAIFLVHGSGRDPEYPPAADQRTTRAPSTVEQTGLAAQIGSFAKDMRVWVYDRGDFTMRLDSLTGTFDDVLLGIESDSAPGIGGMKGRSGGAMGRSGGAFGRSGGAFGRSGGVMPRRIGDGD